jgi:hypothetical protein
MDLSIVRILRDILRIFEGLQGSFFHGVNKGVKVRIGEFLVKEEFLAFGLLIVLVEDELRTLVR